MKRTSTFAVAAVALLGCQADPAAPTIAPPAPSGRATVAPATVTGVRVGNQIAGQYIVVMKPSVLSVMALASTLVASERGQAQVRTVYSAELLNGFAATLTDSAMVRLASDPRVLAVYPDVEVRATVSGVESNAPWGLDRIDQTALPLSRTYAYPNDGAGVTVYVVDTGINYTHADFGGRAIPGYDAVTVGGGAIDCHGHGTHVSGTVGGATYGVAKAATLVGVRVLDCNGSGSTSTVLAGLDYVLRQKRANPSQLAVVNMSLGGVAQPLLDDAVASLVAGGVTTVVAAGNSAADACAQSPARAASAITVAATDASDRFASFSNYGSCVDLAAPGVSIVSDYIGSATAVAGMSGTSMASPHVAGAAALYLAANPSATPAQVATALTTKAITNVIVGAPTGTANRLLFVGFLAIPEPPPNASPTASITAPAAGTSVVQGTAVTFTGSGTDTEDGSLSGTSLVWTSSRDGRIGTGATFATSTLSVGTHTVTLTSTDSKGATGTVTRVITVIAKVGPPPVARVEVHGMSGITYSTVSVPLGGTATFGFTAYDASGALLPSTGRTVTFTSTAPTVFSINGMTGVGRALTRGTFTVIVTIDGTTGTYGATVTVR